LNGKNHNTLFHKTIIIIVIIIYGLYVSKKNLVFEVDYGLIEHTAQNVKAVSKNYIDSNKKCSVMYINKKH